METSSCGDVSPTPKVLEKWLWPALSLCMTTLLLAFMLNVLRMHGAMGLLRWNLKFKLLMSALAVLALLPPLLWSFRFLLKKHPITKGKRLFQVITVTSKGMIVCGLITSIVLYCSFHLLLSREEGDIPALLLVADGNGANGIPNLAVAFRTEEPSINTLRWGTEGLCTQEVEEDPSNQHTFMLRDLQPGTRYWYQVNDGEIMHFSTPDATYESLDFAIASDSHFGNNAGSQGAAERIIGQVGNADHAFDYFFLLGDFVDLGFQDVSWREGIEILAPCAQKIPTRPLIGNHDGIFTGISLYRDYFYPDGMETQSGSPYWYRMDINGIHFFLLDLEWGTESYGEDQREWFESELSRIPPEDWVIVMSHTFYYVSDHFENGDPMFINLETVNELVPRFEENGVDLVISGHAHHMELLEKSGVHYAVIGTMGGELDDIEGYKNSHSLWSNDSDFGFLDISICGDVANLTFRDSDFNILATFSVRE